MSKLQIIQEAEIENPVFETNFKKNSQKSAHLYLKAKFERLWLTEPAQFDPLRNCMEQERIKRSWQLLTTHCQIQDKKVADIGCGTGYFSFLLHNNAAAQIDAIDISENALKILKKQFFSKTIHTFCECMPKTNLSDENYDVIVCLDLIAELPTNEYRLFFAELARLIRADGLLICSSGIDINTTEGVEKLLGLAKTEFQILEVKKSYHLVYLRLKEFLNIPQFYLNANKNSHSTKQAFQKKTFIGKGWFLLNTSWIIRGFWKIIAPFFNFFDQKLNHYPRALHILEKISYFIFEENAVSHCIFIAKRKRIYEEYL